MQSFRNLLREENLSDEQLKSIPLISCEQISPLIEYLVRTGRGTLDEILDGIGVSPEYLGNAHNWVNAWQQRQLERNFAKHRPKGLEHQRTFEFARKCVLKNNSLLAIVAKITPLYSLIKAMQTNTRKWNNAIDLTAIEVRKGSAVYKITYYPFYRATTFGEDPWWTAGVFAASLDIRGITDHQIDVVLSESPVRTLVERFYSSREWRYHEKGDSVWINDQEIGRYVTLATKQIGGSIVYSDAIDESADDRNAVYIEADFRLDGITYFRKGEFYGAPYTLLDARWRDPSLFRRLLSSPGDRLTDTESYRSMDEQISFSNQKLFEANQALAEAERRLAITQTYTRKSLVKIVEAGDDPTTVGPEEKFVTVLFCDIRSYTALAEDKSPMEIVSLLNTHFDAMNNAVENGGGEVDKLIGDSIMAVFDNPLCAVEAAQQMVRSRIEENASARETGTPEIAVSIGLSCGNVVVGNIGSRYKMDFTLIGDPVNVASRVEALTRYYGVDIIVTGEVVEQLGVFLNARFLDTVRVKGKRAPVELYEVFGHKPEVYRSYIIEHSAEYDAAYGHYENFEFEKALSIYRRLQDVARRLSPGSTEVFDPVLPRYLSRCKSLLADVESGTIQKENWSPIFIFHEK